MNNFFYQYQIHFIVSHKNQTLHSMYKNVHSNPIVHIYLWSFQCFPEDIFIAAHGYIYSSINAIVSYWWIQLYFDLQRVDKNENSAKKKKKKSWMKGKDWYNIYRHLIGSIVNLLTANIGAETRGAAWVVSAVIDAAIKCGGEGT